MTQDIKLLITSGCSFSQVPNSDVTWPVHLTQYLNCEAIHSGKGAVGNGVISRTIIYNVTHALKSYKPEELLVGIMWSGCYRHEILLTEEPPNFENLYAGGNPQWVTSKSNAYYYLTNPAWNDGLSQNYYKNFYDETGSQLYTLEHILRVQWFLKSLNIKYFMTKYAEHSINMNTITGNEELMYLYELIDPEYFLGVDNMDTWAVNSGISYARPNDSHPSTEHHKEFVNTFIVPHLKAKNYINK